MSDVTNVQLSPPSNWQDFERLCHGLWKEIWGDSNTQRHGRTGQPQAGVDVFGRPKGQSRYAGVQCKGKDARYGGQVTEDELREEVNKAKSFQPPLREFILATTANTDAGIQELARKLTLEHESTGLFEVVVMSWPEIESRLAQYPGVVDVYLPHQGDTAKKALNAVIQLAQSQGEMKEELSSKGDEVLSRLDALHENIRTLTTGQGTATLDQELGAELDHCRDLLQDNQAELALQLLEKLRTRTWSAANAAIRFRILANIGSAKLMLSREGEAAQDFLDAFACDSSSDKAHANRILAFLLRNDLVAADQVSDAAIRAFPKSPLVWARKVQVIGAREEQFDPAKTVPPDVPDHEELFHAIGFVLGKRSKFAEAETWMRRALALKPDSGEIQMALGDCLAEKVSQGGKLYIGAPLSTTERKDLEEAIELLEGALEKLASARRKQLIAQCAANLSTILMVLSEPQRALEAAEKGLKYHPSDANLLRQKVRLLLGMGKPDEAEATFAQLSPADAEAQPLFYAEFQKRAGNPSAALDHVERYIKSQPDSEEGRVAKCAFVQECMEQPGNYEDKKRRILAVLSLGKPEYRSELIFAEKAHENDDSDGADEALARARTSIEQVNDSRAWISLGDTLVALDRSDEAIALYRRYCTPLNDGPSLRRYVGILMSMDRRRELTELLAKIPESILNKRFYLRVLGEFAYQTGDLQSSLQHFEKLLRTAPRDFQSRARWAEIQLAFRNGQAVEEYLAVQKRTENQLEPQDALEVCRIYRAVGKPLEALRLIYETRRKYPNSEPVNIALMSMLLADRDIDLPNDPKLPVGPDTAFAVQHGGRESIFILENRAIHELRDHEIRPDHQLAVRAMSRQAGDQILLSESAYSREEGTILWVKHKYVHALHETMETLEARFPHQKAFFRVPIEKKDDQLELAPILKALDARAEHTQELAKLYTERHLPLCAVARASRTNILDLWRGFITDTEMTIAVCLGTEEERKRAFDLIQGRTHGFVLEPISLYLLHSLGLLPALEKAYGRFAVTKATLSTYQDLIQERHLHKAGYLSLAKVEGKYVRQEITAEDIASNASLNFHAALLS